MRKTELVQIIGNEICEGCGPDCDCGIAPDECSRVQAAIEALNGFIDVERSKISEWIAAVYPEMHEDFLREFPIE